MKALLDTHIWIWWLLGSDRLSARERQALDQLARDGNAYLSAMSLWEAQMLHSKGRLSLDRSFSLWLEQAASPEIVKLLPLDVDVVITVDRLPPEFHGDPADRLIAATARVHDLVLATHDRTIRSSGVVPIWTPLD
ncbi:MAG: type II toxin-antitoxin system VapC family toxin [Cyanobacteria bacterium M_surface_7_m2_037]|nr:type II toxin-antitoxin system VapC family toxin [Cyanobacteria bacterium K_DeepCast_0m_m1_088]MBM5794950.1 type II toxin-antitoxin system VapC family toxin [Cyanobacteria bacterium M_surface_7_m2_037]MBM5819422.1 type II toxin-antitoxin system VapC family toxin [Cyanobacteria bacterium K_DeepCast_150m_m2_101]